YIIDLQQTQELLDEACAYMKDLGSRGGSMLFVGTKKQAQDAVEENAKRVGMPFVNQRWLGGLRTNWRTISDRIERLHELRRRQEAAARDFAAPRPVAEPEPAAAETEPDPEIAEPGVAVDAGPELGQVAPRETAEPQEESTGPAGEEAEAEAVRAAGEEGGT